MTQTQLVGIDVSARELEVRIQRRENEPSEALRFTNTATGHRQLIRRLSKRQRTARVFLEATGNYSRDLALALHHAPNIEVMVINPRAASDFAKAFLKRSKTDAIDAELLLEFGRRMEFRSWEPPAPELFHLRALLRRCAALTHLRRQEKNRLHAANSCEQLPEEIRNDIKVNIRHFQRRIEKLEQKALDLVSDVPPLRQALAHLTSVKGISRTSGLKILAELAVLPTDMEVRQWVAHTGLDPRRHESGSSVHRPTRISKVGNKYLRAALYMPALTACHHDPHIRAFYEKLIARGKKPLQAIVAVMRKLLHAIYGMLKHGQDFQGEKFYDFQPQNA